MGAAYEKHPQSCGGSRNNGTTYAPLRALAEAYDLEVGYDAENNIATVDKPATPTPSAPTSSNYANFERVWTAEAQSLVPGYTVTGYFTYGQYNLGSTYADGFVTGSNFDPARVWIK